MIDATIVSYADRPTIRVVAQTEHGYSGIVELPSGISVGANEAKLVTPEQAIASIRETVAPALIGADVLEQRAFDERLMELDATVDRSVLGANSLLPVSLAICRAAAAALNRELYIQIAELAEVSPSLPMLVQVMIEGGAHAPASGISLQECSFIGSSADGSAVIEALATLVQTQGPPPPTLGPEGGFVLKNSSNRIALDLVNSVVSRLRQSPALAIDVAASHQPIEAAELATLIDSFPIQIVEDPIEQSKLTEWAAFTARYRDRLLVAADDFTGGDPCRIKDAVRAGTANALVVKLNQTATLSELLDLVSLVRIGNWQPIVSHRGHETPDTFIVDLAVGLGAPYLKIGPNVRADRRTKHARLAKIAEQLAQSSS